MNKNKIVNPSSMVDTFLPTEIISSYTRLVTTLEAAARSEERLGFGQDILQNLNNYRNFDTYNDQIVQYGTLSGDILADSSELTLKDGYGFPEEDGVILIGDEVILYRSREGNTLYGLQRGSSGTKVLPTLRSTGTYLQTKSAKHLSGSTVTNLSVLFIVSILENIHDSYTANITYDRVSGFVNRSVVLRNIRDFFASKGSKLGIQSLFKILFAQNDVDVSYPGDRMIKPSESSWIESPILRTEPFPEILSDPSKPYTTPDKLIGSEIVLRSYNDGKIYGRGVCDYVSSYPFQETVQYELFLNPDKISGSLPLNPETKLTRKLEAPGTGNDQIDVYTITVESTIGFPDSGVLFIENEGIRYTSKNLTQFLNCTRGYRGIELDHDAGNSVYGPYYIEGTIDDNGVQRTSRSWPLSLVKNVRVDNGGLLVLNDTDITINGPGMDDPSEQIIASFEENVGDALTTQSSPNNGQVEDITYGVSGVYYNDDYVVVGSNNFPPDRIGDFSTDGSVGPDLEETTSLHLIPRRHKIAENSEGILKGNGAIGVAVDGVPFYSNESPDNILSGGITSVDIIDGGNGYINPSVVITPGTATADAVVENGKITAINITSNDVFTEIPTVEVTSGRGFVGSITFDNYGRLTAATVVNRGEFFNDVPTIVVVDSSRRGKGAVVKANILNGGVYGLEIVASGIDYNPVTTTLEVVPTGSGVSFDVNVEKYTLDRIGQINNNNAWSLDSNGGFLYEDLEGDRSRYAYVSLPTKLLEGEDGTTHSKLVGWAFDGNPIYGPYGYKNGVDDTDGVARQYSAYVLQNDRTTVIPSGSNTVATAPPSISEYPMGSFIEDYIYDPIAAATGGGRLSTETPDFLTTEVPEYINFQRTVEGIMDENNGKVCNTPEFPVELYPDGVYCYFLSTFGNIGAFPYIIGTEGFHNRPVSQNLKIEDGDVDIYPSEVSSNYDITPVEIDFSRVHRYRNSQLSETKDELEISIGRLSTGSVNDIIIESGLPLTSKVGDSLVFDDRDIDGTGASAVVSYVKGAPVSSAKGEDITTTLISHRQRINIGDTVDNYVFYPGFNITTRNGVKCYVLDFSYETGFLDVLVISPELIRFGDTIWDPDGTEYQIPDLSITGNNSIIPTNTFGGVSTFMSSSEPEGDISQPGDLWWSSHTGRLYVYFDDGDSSQWVTTQPLGMRPFYSASNTETPIGNTNPTTQQYAVAQGLNTVTISTISPTSRLDGTPNIIGDMWWSTHTGILYIWNSNSDNSYDDTSFGYTSQWVSTDPNSVASIDPYASSVTSYSTIVTGSPSTYTGSLKVLISEGAPTTLVNGDPLEVGTLWWSPLNGKMYIYYTDDDTSQWVVTNPIGSFSIGGTSGGNTYNYSPDTISVGGTFADYVSILPELPIQDVLWLENRDHFLLNDKIEFTFGAPGIDELVEQSTIVGFGIGNSVRVIRDSNSLILPNGTQVRNLTRSLYNITTTRPHQIREGDDVTITSEANPSINGEYSVVRGGVIVPAEGLGTITNGEVDGVTISNPGRFYQGNFFVQFSGGGGNGAYGYVTVSSLVDGGQVINVDILNGGSNYTSQPSIIFSTDNTINDFSVYTETKFPEDATIVYSTAAETVMGEVDRVKLLSGGIGYTDLPKVVGVRKKFIDRATAIPKLNGTTVESISITKRGARYVNPKVMIFDITGSGYGAEATVVMNGQQIQRVTVTNPGTDYVEPIVYIVEQDGKYICTTDDIGKVESIDVDNPGRNISADKSLNPEIKFETRLVMRSTTGGSLDWVTGEVVYQGIDSMRTVTAEVVEWDDERQILTIDNINGILRPNEVLYSESGGMGVIAVNGQVSSVVEIDGVSTPTGRFITDASKLSSEYSVVQDSEYYQWFSYEIGSTLQRVEYDTFVNELIHPAGFAMFSKVLVSGEVESEYIAEDIILESLPTT